MASQSAIQVYHEETLNRFIGTNEETQMGYGLLLLGAMEIFLGPGAPLGELQFGWGPLDGYLMRDTNVGLLSLAVGYRLML